MVFNAQGRPLITAVIGPLGVFWVDSREVVVVVPRASRPRNRGQGAGAAFGVRSAFFTSFAGILRVKLRKGA